jgi:uncharacterized protein (DUF305 family)
MRITTSLPVIAAATVAVALTVAGCSSGGTASSGTSSTTSSITSSAAAAQSGAVFNDTDVTFLQQMYPHHAQAVDMATLIDGRTTTPAVMQLGATIKGEQQPEMDKMTSLLTSWGKPAPTTTTTTGGMAGMSNSGLPGMMSADDMSTLTGLSGTMFDQKWLTMMTAHHQGAITMATTELSNGTNPDAKQLATSIISAQKAEIQHMSTLIHS